MTDDDDRDFADKEGHSKPDRSHTRGGTFATTTPVSFVAQDEFVITNPQASAGTHTFTFTPRGSGGSGQTFTEVLEAGRSCRYSGRGIQQVAIDSADSAVTWKVGPRGTVFAVSNPSGGAGSPFAAKYGGGTVETTSATAQSTGFGIGPISPGTLAAIVAQLSGGANSGTTNPKFYIYRNTTGVPAAGTAVGTDTLIATVLIGVTALITGTAFPFPIEGVDAAPVAGAYYYIAYSADGANDVFLITSASSGSVIVVVTK